MVEPGYLDEIGNDYLPDLLNILDFPEESLEGGDSVGDWDASMLQCLGPIPSDVLMGLSPVRQPNNIENGSLRTAFKSKAFVETPGAPLLYPSEHFKAQQSGSFLTRSPVSVLESSNSCSGVKTMPIKSEWIVPVRSRSKRARSSVNPWTLIPPIPSPAFASRRTWSGKKQREKKAPVKNGPEAATSDQHCSLVKKCTHCEVTKTPQWREGPMGPKTLCNACGVRYRSGRLFPEYRPAASPTFVPTLHSNSHRKVVEMRRKAILQVEDSHKNTAEEPAGIEGHPISPLPEFNSISRPASLTC